MPALAEHFQVIAVDQRGRGLSDKPADGYDTGTLANDLVALMDALGHERFAVVGHDTGFAISYALAADHPERVERVALAEIPGSPGAAPSPPVFVPGFINDRLWHLPVQPAPDDQRAARHRPRGHLLRLGVRSGRQEAPGGRRSPTTSASSPIPDALRASFEWYRALDTTIAQDAERKTKRLTMPVLAIGGELSFGEHVADAMKLVADDVQSVVLQGAGHFVAEESPDELLEALERVPGPVPRGRGRRRLSSECRARAGSVP